MGKSFHKNNWNKFVSSVVLATFLSSAIAKADPNEWTSIWGHTGTAFKSLNSFRCKMVLGGLALGGALATAGFLYFDSSSDTNDEGYQGIETPVRPEDVNLPLFPEGTVLSTFRFGEEGTSPPTVAIFHGPDQKFIAKSINRQAVADEQNPDYLRRLERLHQSLPHRDEALYVEFDGILFERLREDSQRARVFLSVSTREVLLSRGTLEEIKPLLLRIRANNGSQGDHNDVRRRQSISVSELEKGEEIDFSWFPAADVSALGSGQPEATARIRYEKRTGKIFVSRAISRLEVTSYFVRGGVQRGSASFENLEATRGTLPRKPMY